MQCCVPFPFKAFILLRSEVLYTDVSGYILGKRGSRVTEIKMREYTVTQFLSVWHSLMVFYFFIWNETVDVIIPWFFFSLSAVLQCYNIRTKLCSRKAQCPNQPTDNSEELNEFCSPGLWVSCPVSCSRLWNNSALWGQVRTLIFWSK